METELLKEILESYKILKDNYSKQKYYSYDTKGKGTKKYTLDRIAVLRSRLLEIQKDIKNY